MARSSARRRGPSASSNACTESPPLREIQFHENGTPTGPNKSKFTNHVSWLVRDRVSCTIKTWALVNNDLKECICLDIKLFWNITTDTHKDRVIKYMGVRWKAWKNRLRKDFIPKEGEQENLRYPWEHGHKVEAAEWEVFKAYVNSQEFKDKSAKGKANAMKNIHPHRLGSGGYETTLNKWKPTDVISLGSSSTVISTSTDDRGYTWLRARAVPTEEDGVYVISNPATQGVGERVQTLAQEVLQGMFQPVRHNDVLSASIGTREYGGRARGRSGWTGLKVNFGTGSRRLALQGDYVKRDEVQRLIQQALQLQAQQYSQQMVDVIRQANVIPSQHAQSRPTQVGSNCEAPMQVEDVQACVISNQADVIPPQHAQSRPNCEAPMQLEDVQACVISKIKEQKCNLFTTLDGTNQVLVAHGRFDPSSGGTVHHSTLEPGQVRVCIDKVVEGFELLPVPYQNEEQEYLGHCKGGFLKWPSCLMQICEQETQEKHVETDKGDETGKGNASSQGSAICPEPLLDDETLKRLDKSAKFLYNLLLAVEESIEVEKLMEIFGSVAENCTWLLKEDVVDVFKDNPLSITVLQVFCLACAQRLNDFANTRFTFLDPFTCSDTHMDKDLKTTTHYLYSSFNRAVKDKSSFLLLPYHEKDHWMLIIVKLSKKNCYVVNSLARDYLRDPMNIQSILTAALNLHLLDQPKNKGQKKMSKFNFKLLESPKQQGASVCGYYVMRAMYDLTTKFAGADTMPEKLHPTAPHPYPAIEIEEVKGVLVDFIRKFLC